MPRATALLSPLSACHLAFMTLIAVYLCVFHPAGEQAVWIIFAAGVVAELAPRGWRRLLIGEALLVASAGASYLWLVPRGSIEGVHAAVGMGLAYWLLVPSRLGLLRWVLSLVIVELVLQGNKPGASLGALVSLPLGLAALAIDGWLSGAVPARSGLRLRQQSGASLVRWALLPALIATGVALSGGSVLVKQAMSMHLTHQPRTANIGTQKTVVAGLDDTMHIGNHQNVDRDPRVAARLSWETGADPTGMVYLRALALSQLELDGGALSWKAARTPILAPAPPPSHAPTRWARVLRLPSPSDVVLRPDGGDAVDLDALLTDGNGNLYRPQLGEAMRSYRADFDDGQIEADARSLPLYRQLPRELDALPWQEIEDPHWREVNPERAADLIKKVLDEHCHYDLEKLPPPAPGAGGVLRTFLFAPDEHDRRGHCQYFATSEVLLLRRAGHVARCVVGFASDELDDRGVVFRGLHAHAWTEVVNSKGRWQRCDPTPAAARNSLISAGIPIDRDPVETPNDPPPVPIAPLITDPAQARNHTFMAVAACGALLALLLVWWMVRQRGVLIDPRLAELQRHTDSLFRVAASLGVPVGPASTLTQVAESVQAKTGIDLSRHLAAHLAARFGNGPMPEPWPLDQLKAGTKTRREPVGSGASSKNP